jgi:multicomponent Na+:H+ antiporter subunit E
MRLNYNEMTRSDAWREASGGAYSEAQNGARRERRQRGETSVSVFRTVSLFAVLGAVWLLWSGHYTGLMLTLGALSCALVVYIAHRMDVIDHEGHPIHLTWRFPAFWAWLMVEIVKSNIDVTRRVLHPKLPIDPRLFVVKTSQHTDLGRVIYANAITLTPGTVSTDVRADSIQVHALSAEGEAGLMDGAMDAKVTTLEGEA